MRRPAQHATIHQHDAAWSRPYTGIEALAVFYNAGGAPDPAAPPTPPAPPTGGTPPDPAPMTNKS